MKRKLLIFIPSPRDLVEFHKAIAKIKHDKIWMKYMPYTLDPYNKARQFFLDHEEYTHFAICPDDLMVTPRGIAKLWKESEKYGIISGLCNVNLDDLSNRNPEVAVTKNLPQGKREGRIYMFFRKSELPQNTVFPVSWSGTAFMIIPRHILEKITFVGDGPWNGGSPFSYDIGIAHALQAMQIPQYVDTSVFFKHYRVPLAKYLNLHEPDWWFDKVDHPRKYGSGKEFIPEMFSLADIERGKPPLSIPDAKKQHVLQCQVCLQEITGNDLTCMMDSLDHGLGNLIGRPCPNDKTKLLLDGLQVFDAFGNQLITLKVKRKK